MVFHSYGTGIISLFFLSLKFLFDYNIPMRSLLNIVLLCGVFLVTSKFSMKSLLDLHISLYGMWTMFTCILIEQSLAEEKIVSGIGLVVLQELLIYLNSISLLTQTMKICINTLTWTYYLIRVYIHTGVALPEDAVIRVLLLCILYF